MKNKLEHALDELEDSLECEKRTRVEQEKQRKKAENELRMSQENVNIAEKGKAELDDVICRKNKEMSALTSKLQDEQVLVARGLRQIKECSVSN